MSWKKKTIDLGEIKFGSKHKVVFEALTDLEVSTTSSGCGCTTPVYDDKTRKLTVTYKVESSMPIHLRHLSEQQVYKRISVYYKDGSREVLTIKATLKN